ncbi:MAG: RNA 2',3'-cyclic phosphodiesterase [Candidatus Methylomirabilia bacterium]
MRAFIALEIPEAVKQGMAAAQGRLKGSGVDASWSRPEGMHLTLRFLGEVSEGFAREILETLTGALAGTERFQVGVEGVGTFPNPRNARVAWVGICGDLARLAALQAAVELALAGLGIAPEDRSFAPHLTLGRIKRIRQRGLWLKALDGIKDCKLPGFEVAAVSLMQSELKPGGAVYREIGRVALK